MIISLRNILFPVLIFIFSCDKQGSFTSCSECTIKEPVIAKISAKLDPFDPSNLPTELRVYEGNLEDNLLLRKITSQNGPIEISVYINKKYTITATYYNNGMIYTAIDSATPKTRLESKRCEEPCFYVIDNIVDLRIRYTR